VRNTKNQTTTRTLTDLLRAAGRQHAVTITYLKPGETEPTVRTIEIHEIRTTAVKIKKTGKVTGGGLVIIAMCRLRGEGREFHLSGILAYTLHRIPYVLKRPANTTYQPAAPQPTDDADALFFHELARDQDDADYRPRVKLTQADTDLAA
jgi:predicted DNA-binding transcriptional regulator YafY